MKPSSHYYQLPKIEDPFQDSHNSYFNRIRAILGISIADVDLTMRITERAHRSRVPCKAGETFDPLGFCWASIHFPGQAPDPLNIDHWPQDYVPTAQEIAEALQIDLSKYPKLESALS